MDHRRVWCVWAWPCAAFPSCGGQSLPEVARSDNVTLTEEDHRELLWSARGNTARGKPDSANVQGVRQQSQEGCATHR